VPPTEERIWAPEILLPFGIVYSSYFIPINSMSPVFWIEVVRSLWQGRFALLNGVPGALSLRWLKRGATRPAIPGDKDGAT
jgi:hypothetical protein